MILHIIWMIILAPPIKHSFLGALIGAIIVLWIYRLVAGRTSKT